MRACPFRGCFCKVYDGTLPGMVGIDLVERDQTVSGAASMTVQPYASLLAKVASRKHHRYTIRKTFLSPTRGVGRGRSIKPSHQLGACYEGLPKRRYGA